MRRGLLFVGLAIALIGGGIIGSLFFLAGAQTTTIYNADYAVPSGTTENSTLKFTPTGAGSLSFSWSSSGPTNVSVFAVEACSSGSGTCPSGPALVSWASVSSGRWSMSGSIGSYYTVSSTNSGALQVQFSGTFTETYTTGSSGLSLAQLTFILAGAVVLLAIGGVSIFLGLFLRGGVYSDPAGNVALPRPRPRTELDDPDEPFEDDEPEP